MRSIISEKDPDTLIIGATTSPDTLDPALNPSLVGDALIDGIYEKLLNSVEVRKGSIKGEIASSWNIASDKKTINFTIEKGHYFVLPSTGENTSIEINAWIMKYSIDRMIITGAPLGDNRYLEPYLQGTNFTIWDKNEGKWQNAYMHEFDVNLTHMYEYLEKNAVEVVDDWTLRINVKYGVAAVLGVLTTNVGCAVNPVWIAESIPASYTEYQYINHTQDNNSAMVPLDWWFPQLAGNYTKLGFQNGWNGNISGVVPSIKMNSQYIHTNMTSSACGSGPYYLLPSETDFQQQAKCQKNYLWTKWDEVLFSNRGHEYVLIRINNNLNTHIDDILEGDIELVALPHSYVSRIINIDRLIQDGTIKVLSSDMELNAYLTHQNSQLYFLGINQHSLIASEWVEEAEESKYNASDWYPYSWSEDNGNPPFSDNRTIHNNPFANSFFRLAMSKAIDTEKLIIDLEEGIGEPQQGIIPQHILGATDFLIDEGYQPQYDPEGTKALFEALGWRGTITLVLKDRDPVTRTLAMHIESTIEEMDVGIKILLREVSHSTYITIQPELPMVLIEHSTRYPDANNYLERFYVANQGYAVQLNYSNPVVSELITESKNEGNLQERAKIIENIERNVSLDYAYITLYQSRELTVVANWIYGEFDPERSLFQPWEEVQKFEIINGVSTNITSESESTTSTWTSEETTTSEIPTSTSIITTTTSIIKEGRLEILVIFVSLILVSKKRIHRKH